jgi:Fe-S cluster assembly iron-binding protein IscA
MNGITDRAGEKLRTALGGPHAGPKQCVRIEVTLARGGTIRFDVERPGDTVFDYDGQKVLVLDQRALEMYANRKLDYQENKFCFV